VSPQKRASSTPISPRYYERGRWTSALQELDEAVKLDAANPKIYNIYGLVYTVLGKDAKAEQNFARALSLAPQEFRDRRRTWGWYLCTARAREESLPEFERAVSNPLYKTPEIPLINTAGAAR